MLKQEVSEVDDRVAALEWDKGAMAHTVDHLQSAHTDLSDQVVQLHLLLDDLENRSQNIRLRAITETVTQAEMHSQVTAIFNRYLDRPPDTEVAIDRVHRTLGPRPTPQDRPRDVLCRLHAYKLKEEIVQ